MKSVVYKVIVLVMLLSLVAGCKDKAQTDYVLPDVENNEPKLIEAVKSDSINTVGLTKLKEFSTDLDMDKIEESIELYTAAGRDEKGEMLWDDGQNWLLVVRDGDKSYPLLSGFVQLGQVYFAVSRKGAEENQNITVIVPTGASFSITGYTFDNKKSGFIRKRLYEAEDDNFIYSSIPGY